MTLSFETLLRAATALEHRITQIDNEGIPEAQERRNKGIEALLREGLQKDKDAVKEIRQAMKNEYHPMGTAPKEMLETIDDFPSGTAVIVYRDGSGVVKDWAIGADPEMDDEKSLRAHLAKHLPAAEFIDFAIK